MRLDTLKRLPHAEHMYLSMGAHAAPPYPARSRTGSDSKPHRVRHGAAQPRRADSPPPTPPPAHSRIAPTRRAPAAGFAPCAAYCPNPEEDALFLEAALGGDKDATDASGRDVSS